MTTQYRKTNLKEWNMFHVIALRKYGVEDIETIMSFGKFVYETVNTESRFPNESEISDFFESI